VDIFYFYIHTNYKNKITGGIKMPEKLIKKIRTSEGDLQIDYNALANLPELGQVSSLDEIGKDNLSAEVQETLNKIGTKASSIDLSTFDSDGRIIETFADGSTRTTTMEFDADGNPIKITDADGNVTILTWGG
jgi:YD repeat-containing protein